MKSIRAQLSLSILMILLITIGLIGLFTNLFINRAFRDYISEQGKIKSETIAGDLGRFYDSIEDEWDTNTLHIAGMYAMDDGYFLKVYNLDGEMIWDAEDHDGWRVMDEIMKRLERCPCGNFVTLNYDIGRSGRKVGSVLVTSYGPYCLGRSEFSFLKAINNVLIVISVMAAVFSIFVGYILARRITLPVTKTAYIAKQIAEGNYDIRFEHDTKLRELNDLTTSVNNLAEGLSKQEVLRKRLTSDVAHELRTPLTAVGSHLEAMIEGLWETTPERLQSCHDEVKRLEMLVDDLERLAKAESDTLKLNKTAEDLLEIVQTVADNMRAETKKKDLSLTVEGSSSIVLVDKDRLNQVLTNLFSNAVKYTPEGGNIRIEVTDTEQAGVVKVTDSGVGIPEQDIPLIFERFYRTENSRNRKSGGAGIGLTIVKTIVTAHDGTVTAESVPDGGSCFTVTLPRAFARGALPDKTCQKCTH